MTNEELYEIEEKERLEIRLRAKVEWLAEWGDWCKTGINPETGSPYSLKNQSLTPDDSDACWKRCREDYADALDSLKKLEYTGKILVTGFLRGNSWAEVVWKYEDLESLKGWLFDSSYDAEEAVSLYNDLALKLGKEELPLGDAKTVALRLLENEREIPFEESMVYLTTVPELIVAIETGGEVPSYANLDAQKEVIAAQASKIRLAIESRKKLNPIAEDACGLIN